MKPKILLILFLLLYQNSFSQEEKWSFYNFDSIVSLEMPFVVYEIDTIIDYNKLYQISSSDDSSRFIVQKLHVGKLYSNIETPVLPKNKETLKKFYVDLIETFSLMIPHKLDSRKPIQKNNLNGYRLMFIDSDGIEIQETDVFFVNKSLYSFSYFDKVGLNEVDENAFFNSITFDKERELLQFPVQTISLLKKVILGLFAILFLSIIYRFKSKKQKL